jgi:2-polyprenyl-3-methyl-5-hydroxy-6-metoxy-1,4-benzoquinol methylase
MKKLCPICFSGSFEYMRGVYDCSKTSVMECECCGLQFLSPMMSEQEESEYYINYYNSQKQRHFETKSLNDIQNDSYQHYREYINVYDELISDGMKVLEVGCGTGGFIKLLYDKYNPIEVVAVEKSANNVTYLSNQFIDYDNFVLFSELEEVKRKDFDLIVMIGVLEHIRNPSDILKKLSGMLDSKGKILITVPNKHDFLIEFLGLEEYTKFMYMKQHHFTFTDKAIEIIAQSVNMKLCKTNYIQKWGIDNLLSWLRNRRPSKYEHLTEFCSTELQMAYKNNLIQKRATDLVMYVLEVE